MPKKKKKPHKKQRTIKPLDIEEELKHQEFRVSIFGSARPKPDDPVYKETFQLAKAIGELGVDLVTGGGPGLMAAASLGHSEGDKKNVAHSIGLNIRLPFEQKANLGLEMIETHERFSTRLDEFMLLSSAVVVMPGGIGTTLELFYTWQLLQVKHLCRMPVILVGKMWRKLIEWVIDYPLHENYISSEDLNFIVLVDDWKEAFKVIKKAKKVYEEEKDTCLNWEKYGYKFRKGTSHDHDINKKK